jgi:hypothetical protein
VKVRKRKDKEKAVSDTLQRFEKCLLQNVFPLEDKDHLPFFKHDLVKNVYKTKKWINNGLREYIYLRYVALTYHELY